MWRTWSVCRRQEYGPVNHFSVLTKYVGVIHLLQPPKATIIATAGNPDMATADTKRYSPYGSRYSSVRGILLQSSDG
jgi:hypothetical protein